MLAQNTTTTVVESLLFGTLNLTNLATLTKRTTT